MITGKCLSVVLITRGSICTMSITCVIYALLQAGSTATLSLHSTCVVTSFVSLCLHLQPCWHPSWTCNRYSSKDGPPKVWILTRPKSVQIFKFLKDLALVLKLRQLFFPSLISGKRGGKCICDCTWGSALRQLHLEGFFMCPLTYSKSKSQICI